jgi:predicted PurR-regulated permease PerM
MRETRDLVDLLARCVRSRQALLIVLVGTLLSLGFWAVGLPYFILVGAFAGSSRSSR